MFEDAIEEFVYLGWRNPVEVVQNEGHRSLECLDLVTEYGSKVFDVRHDL
jgi:hypothetical protein